MKILILGGTTEASELVRELSVHKNLNVTLALAGRTQTPVLPEVNCRIGGFGGALGLAQYIRENNINALVCATHPFARKMPFNAAEAAEIAGIPLLFILRPAWQAKAGDKWIEVDSHAQALSSCGLQSSITGSCQMAKDPVQSLRASQDDSKNIFLTVGRLELAEYEAAQQHYYVVRSIDEVAEKTLKNAKYITSRPPFNVADERALMISEKIDFVITKNSGGKATEAKLVAARELGISVILINRPARPIAPHVATARQAFSWIKGHKEQKQQSVGL